MKERNLPIKIVEKRKEVDERYNERGGGNEAPGFVLKGEELRTKAEILSKDLVEVKKGAENSFTKYKDLPVVMKAKISDSAIAKSYREDLEKLIVNDNFDRVFGISDEYELLIRIDNKSELDRIGNNICEYNRNALAVSGIEYMKVSKPVIDMEDILDNPKEEKVNFKVKLQNFNNKYINEYVERVFLSLLEENNITLLNKTNYTDTLTIYKVTCDSIEEFENLTDFGPLASVEPMPRLVVGTDSFFENSMFEVGEYDENIEYPIVGVLDSGIDEFTQLGPWILDEKFSSVPKAYRNYSHGTFVGGIIAFGDLLEGRKHTGVNGCRLYDANIIPDKNKMIIEEDDLVDSVKDAIRETIEDKGIDIKIWNMSLGTIAECSENKFSDLGMALDSVQKEFNILIVKSAGNCDNFKRNKPVSRIARGADSIRSLTVGSIAHEKSEFDLSDINHASPFSRVGPGPMNIIKPELVHYGGNAGLNQGELCITGVKSFSRSGEVVKSIGTSFSTPRVSAIAADLSNRINEEFDPLLVKALLIHSARYPMEVDLDINDKLNEIGFGIPKCADEVLYNDEDEITLIIRDTLTKGEYIEIADFPFPKSLIDENSVYDGQVFVTVVSDPILEEGANVEYCQSDVQVKFGTYDEKEFRDTSMPRIKNELGILGNQNLLTTSIYSRKKSDKDKREFALTEKMQLKYQDKYYPVKKYALDLSELTPANKEKFTVAPKLWYLRVEGLYRKFAEDRAKRERKDLSQEVCLILTIRDPKRRGKVYTEMVEHLENYNFIHRNINIKTEINVSLED